jgi:predicted ATP-binding protein involved in virulence
MTTKLTKLQLKNIGGFKNVELNFHENLTVFMGRNGTGKTTILRSIALLFDMALETLLEHVNDPYSNKENRENLVYPKFSTHEANSLLFGNRFDSQISIDLCINGKTFSLKHDEIGAGSFYRTLHDLHHSQQHLPLFLYYPASQAPVGPIAFSDLKLENNPFAAYISACKEGVFDFDRFFAWFKWQENINREVGNNKKYEVIRQSIYKVISDEQNTFDNLHVTWQKNPNGDLCIEKNGTLLDINQLSAGEKMLMILVADLTRRLIIANPSSDEPLQQDGVILIDEIDLHLHPSWQRAIVPHLRNIFPNCQFIMTTHSPQIISHVKPESLFILRENSILHPEESYGKNTDRILEDLMDTDARPLQSKQRLHELFVLIQAKKLAEAKDLMAELQTEIGMDSELVKAKVLLKRMEIIGK